MERSDESTRMSDISIALIVAYIAEHIEDAFTRFLHLFTDTTYPQTDLTPGIISSMVASVGVVGMGKKANVIASSFFSTGIIYAIIAVYENMVNCEEIDYEKIVKRFIYDGSFIAIIMYFYNKAIEELKLKQKRYYNGDLYRVIKEVIKTIPISIYFGYRAFISNIEKAKDEESKLEKDKEESNQKESNNESNKAK